MIENLDVRWLGRVRYETALAMQEEHVARKIDDPQAADVLLLLEHEPIYTIGRTPDASSLGNEALLPHRVVRIHRGGQATYHGPGQLVGYPIVDLRRRGQDLHRYLRALEELLIEVCAHFGVIGERRERLTGVWVAERKIASFGVGVRRWITMHGFALNVCGNLAPFSCITPCGIAGVEMTSMERETSAPVDVACVAQKARECFVARLGAVLPLN